MKWSNAQSSEQYQLRPHTRVKGTKLTLHRILDGCTSEKKSITTMKRKERFPSVRRTGLDGLSFIENHVLPFHPLEVLFILYSLDVSVTSIINSLA